MDIKIVRPTAEHRSGWEQLYAAYARFYNVEQTDGMRDRVWGWITTGDEEEECFLAVDQEENVVGLAHFRQFTRPLSASRGGFLDDLFVDPAVRGSGAAQALIDSIADEGRKRGWTVIRWITKDDNYRARAVYDRLAKKTEWLTYDLAL